MGSETAETPEVSTEETTVVVEPTESENAAEASEVSDGEEQQEPVEVEVVLSGANGSQPDTQHEINRIVKKRVNKLNTKVAKANDTASQAEEALDLSRQENQLLKMALAQRTPAEMPTVPDPKDFNDGVKDPGYVKALDEFNEPRIAAAVQRQTAHLAPVQTETIDPGLERNQTKHYERANKLGAKDFDETEDIAIGLLGRETTNHVINEFEESELLMYYLGKNPGKAEEIAELIKTNPIKGVAELGRLSAKLSVQPKGINESTPDPDEEIPGGSPSANKTNRFQKKYDAAIKSVQDGGGKMSDVSAVKREAQEAGVTVI